MERENGVGDFVLPYTLAQHAAFIAGNELTYLSIYHCDVLVGFIILRQESDQVVEFRRIVIAARGKGLGQNAIKAMESYCVTQLGCQRIWLDVFADNQRGLHIYHKLAFVVFHEQSVNNRRLLLLQKYLTV
uniref:GNAT family N-acetyltransferase n=1 Tax=Thaumasiovibrio occultus TaxID=1891184 RepID=UPI000B360914|nr:GNAT family N-acetyltransferase [Thaumasiovibrio occultus]